MTHTRPFRSSLQLTTDTLELAISRLINASQPEFLAILKQLPKETRRELVVKVILDASFAEKIEIMRGLPLEETGELAQAIALVWQEED